MRVVIVGCGVVGATIAYELSQRPDLQITVLDRRSPSQPEQTTYETSTGAALGVLLAALSTKEKGRNLRMRLASTDWYDRVVPELEAATGQAIPYNRQGILMLQFQPESMLLWEKLVDRRSQQNRRLELWTPQTLRQAFPTLNLEGVVAGIYSPDDRQIHPMALTQALIQASQQRGVEFRFQVAVEKITTDNTDSPIVQTAEGTIDSDVVVLSAGIGTTELTTTLNQPIDVQPVLGQAVQVRVSEPWGQPEFQPVVTGQDIHLVPLGNQEYWVGASVELPPEHWGDTRDMAVIQPHPEMLEAVWQGAVDRFPMLARAERLRQWSGLRPRPFGRPAPIIEWLPNHPRVLLASAHYRNGVLLAPATAMQVREMLVELAGGSAGNS